MSLTFGEQVKIVLKNRNMTIKELADQIENYTGKPMSRQNLTQKLGRNNFQEQDMRMIAEILNLNFTLDILGGEDIKLPVDKVLEGNMTIDEVLNLESNPEVAAEDSEAFKTADLKDGESVPEKFDDEKTTIENPNVENSDIQNSDLESSSAGLAKEKDKKRRDEVDSVSFMKKKSSFEEQPIDMYNYRSKKDLFINLEEADQTQKPEKSSDELIADLLREMEEIEREQQEQEQETRERQEKWEQEKKSKGLRSVLSGLFGRGKKKQQQEETPEIEEVQTNVAESGDAFQEDIVADTESEDRLESAIETVEDTKSENGLINQNLAENTESPADKDEQVKSQKKESVIIEERKERDPNEGAEEKDSEVEEAESTESEVGNAEKAESENGESPEESQESEKESEKTDEAAEESENKETEILGEINPYTGKEYENNTVRNHKNKIGYVEVYNSEKHAWVAMTEWAFLGFQEKLKVELGKDYKQPFFMD